MSSLSDVGEVQDNVWEVRLDELFDKSADDLSFSLSDDLEGAAVIEDGVLRVKLDEIGDSAAFSVTAADANGLRTELPFDFSVSRPTANIENVADVLKIGELQDNVWTLDLHDVFDASAENELTYTLSDDHGGAVTIDNGILRADLSKLDENSSFIVSAANAGGMRAELPFDLSLPSPEVKCSSVSDLGDGKIHENIWELPLDSLFDDPAGSGFNYTLSDDLDGAAVIEDGILRVDLSKLDGTAAFSVEAVNAFHQAVKLPIELTPDFPKAKYDQVSDAFALGQVSGDCWELDLNELFDTSKADLSYTLSDDFDSTATIENGILKLHPNGKDSFSFSVVASSSSGLSTELPIEVSFPAPAAKVDSVSDTVKTGLFQNGTWERTLDDLFEDPKGTDLTYTLSDTYNGALTIENETLHADCTGIGEAAFAVQATDTLGLQAEVPFRLIEQSMTLTILGIILLVILVLILLFWLYRRNRRK